MAINSSLPNYIHTVSRLSETEPNTGKFENSDQRQSLIRETSYSKVVLSQEEDRNRRSAEVYKKIICSVNGTPTKAAALAGGAAGVALGATLGQSSGVVGQVTRIILGGTAVSIGGVFALALIGGAGALCSLPIMDFYYKHIVDESSDELFKKDLLKLILSDANINPICPLTRKAIKIPAVSNLGKDDPQLFEFEALLKHVREKGTHPISNKPMGEEHIYSCLSAYRLVEKRLNLLLKEKDKTNGVTERDWKKLEKFHEEIKNSLRQGFNNEAHRLVNLKEQAEDDEDVIEGEKDPLDWYAKRSCLLNIDAGSNTKLPGILRRAFKEIDTTSDPKINKFFMALLFQPGQLEPILKPDKKLTDSHFLEFLELTLSHNKVVHVLLDTAKECSFEESLSARKRLIRNSIESSQFFDEETTNKLSSLFLRSELDEEVKAIFSLAGV